MTELQGRSENVGTKPTCREIIRLCIDTIASQDRPSISVDLSVLDNLRTALAALDETPTRAAVERDALMSMLTLHVSKGNWVADLPDSLLNRNFGSREELVRAIEGVAFRGLPERDENPEDNPEYAIPIYGDEENTHPVYGIRKDGRNWLRMVGCRGGEMTTPFEPGQSRYIFCPDCHQSNRIATAEVLEAEKREKDEREEQWQTMLKRHERHEKVSRTIAFVFIGVMCVFASLVLYTFINAN